MKHIAVIGGGTGTFVVLSGLKRYQVSLSAVVTMMDSGGSTGRLRDQLGVLPPGDLRQCLVALSDASELWRELFLYRFENGDLKGHNFGNIFLTALAKVSGDYSKAIDTVSYVLKTKGSVLPVTYDHTDLCVEYENGVVIRGETNIDEDNPQRSRIKKAYLSPDVGANQKALEHLTGADYIIIGPGDLYTSIIPVLLVRNIKSAIKKSNAQIVYIMNLVTKAGQTTDYTAFDHLRDLSRYLGRSPDIILMNNGPVDEAITDWYESHTEHLVKDDITAENFSGNVIRDDLVDRSSIAKSSADELTRSILRHSSQKVAQILTHHVLELYAK